MLAALTGSKSSWMLLASERLKVIHVSTHVSLRTAIDRAKPERVLATIRTGYEHLKRMGYENPRIAVAGINPHCGENGLFGTEDDEFLRPAVEQAKAEGMNVSGPISADTVYHRAYQGAFDLVIAQYHDQGHIPIKLVAFDSAVTSRSACRSTAPRSTMAPPSILPALARPTTSTCSARWIMRHALPATGRKRELPHERLLRRPPAWPRAHRRLLEPAACSRHSGTRRPPRL